MNPAEVRAFVAVEIPGEVRNNIAGITDEARYALDRTRLKVKWVETENVHLTLKFLGEVGEDRLGEIAGALDSAAAGLKPFSLFATGLGAFPSLSNPRVFWVGVQDEEGACGRLWERIEEAMFRLGFEREQKGFKAHMTVGRVKRPGSVSGVKELLSSLAGRQAGRFTAGRIKLFKSELRPQGPIYTPLHEIALDGEGTRES